MLCQKLSPDMPLQLASDTILRTLRARVHHHRQGQVNIFFWVKFYFGIEQLNGIVDHCLDLTEFVSG
jgi:hypothetical protein